MQIKELRISGFKPIPFCAEYTEPNNNDRVVNITWEPCSFQLNLAEHTPHLNALIGPNSSGKSSVFHALGVFFSSKTKLDAPYFNNGRSEDKIIIEITLFGGVPLVQNWHLENCTQRQDDVYELKIANIWTTEKRTTYIHQDNAEYRKAGTADKQQIKLLIPEYRLIAAESKMSDEANPDKNNLVTDLIKDVLEQRRSTSNRSIVYKVRNVIKQLNDLVDRDSPPNPSAWREVEALEQALSQGISPMTPGKPTVKIQIHQTVPTIDQLFLKGRIRIDDGIELDFENHGLGLQRSFIASALHAWCEIVGHKENSKNYVFAIEEPELYLHPHAIRVFLNTLEEIANFDQVLFSTHSSEFVNTVPLDNVICIRRQENTRHVVQPDLSALSTDKITKVQRYMREDHSDMLFARAVVLVEGQSELFALPSLGRKIGINLDTVGVSVVFVNGKGNFETYHNILEAFDIPHVIFADGDGNARACEERYNPLADDVYVLDEDFEHLIVITLDSDERYLAVINECRVRWGEQPIEWNDAWNQINPENLRSGWWRVTNSKIIADINDEHRNQYSEQLAQINQILDEISTRVVENEHIYPTAPIKRKTKYLKRQGKPLVGRVVGDVLVRQEVVRMGEVVDALRRVVDLAE